MSVFWCICMRKHGLAMPTHELVENRHNLVSPKNGDTFVSVLAETDIAPRTGFWNWWKGVRAELEMEIGLDWTRHDRSQPKWMWEKRQSCMGTYTSVTHFSLYLMQCVGSVWTSRNIALPVFLSGWECQTITFVEQCTGSFSAAWGRDAALIVLISGVVLE